MSSEAFGAPGSAPTWCSSDKDFVTTALGAGRVWATIGHGIVNEVYWPSTGRPQIRDFGFYLVGAGGWIDLKRVQRYRLATPGAYLPALTITHEGDDYQLSLEILPDPLRDALLVRFKLRGDYRLVVLLAPHLGSTGHDNTAWIEDGMAYAAGGGDALCLAADPPLAQLSCGFAGTSDGWQDLNAHGRLTYAFTRASAGTVALAGAATGAEGVLALAFAADARGARTLARTALADGFDVLRAQFLQDWSAWGAQLRLPRPNDVLGDAALLSATVLKIHEDRTFPGAVVASLSVPWGNSTDSLGGYHLVWPRDATLTAFALLAANQRIDARHILGHLMVSQQSDGHWSQNYFPDGTGYWNGMQLDETAFPVLLAAKLRELGDGELPGIGAMVRAAVGHIVRTGPASEQDRWEENPGVSPFTLAVAICALVAAAPWLSAEECAYALSVAEGWNERLESWCYVKDNELARELGVAGYYVRIAAVHRTDDWTERVHLCNRDGEVIRASALVSLDFSYLVRLGLRRSDDPRIKDTIKVIDHILRVETPSGPLYHRYNEDGYGEHADGSPFDGRGIGRAWPLLVGERGHLALQSGADSTPYLRTIWNCASIGGLLPEQAWDSPAIPARGLFPGRPSGSAMPLLWAHAEFLKLVIAQESGRPVEMLEVVEQHFGGGAPRRDQAWHWRTEVPVWHLQRAHALVIEDRRPFTLHFGFDDWQHITDRDAREQPFGMWGVTLSVSELEPHGRLDFTRRYGASWEGVDHHVTLGHQAVTHALASARTSGP
ncbi:MAG TPA: glycoside hydrolase family 15 protein [Steroidobacteraceae bacterium]|jgi:glucoamylase